MTHGVVWLDTVRGPSGYPETTAGRVMFGNGGQGLARVLQLWEATKADIYVLHPPLGWYVCITLGGRFGDIYAPVAGARRGQWVTAEELVRSMSHLPLEYQWLLREAKRGGLC